MSIFHLDISTYKQQLKVSQYNKQFYGEVNTRFSLINKMLDFLPSELFCNPCLKWMDPGCGSGYFSMLIYKRLYNSLEYVISDNIKRHKHIIENMLFMCELNKEHIQDLRLLFGENANIYNKNFLTLTDKYDVIIGNPPYNSKGLKKVPTNNIVCKKQDGITIWTEFVKHSMILLKRGGYMNMIIPSIWMKPDKAGIYKLLTSYNIRKIHCFTNTQTNQLFSGQAQTPTCICVVKKSRANKFIELNDGEKYRLNIGKPIPVFGCDIINILAPFVEKYGLFDVFKTSTPSKSLNITQTENKYKNIRSCVLRENTPYLTYEYSDEPCMYYGKPKIVMAHKMYGFPIYDVSGTYGISRRDSYVILKNSYTNEEMERICQFFHTKLMMYVFESTRYRMKYLEKYAFEFIPNIMNIPDFPEIITDETIQTFFFLSTSQKNKVNSFQKKKYSRCKF